MTDTNQEVRETPAWTNPLERCPDCRGRTFCQTDERQADGSYKPGRYFRCVNCKATFNGEPAALASAPPPAVPDAVGVWTLRSMDTVPRDGTSVLLQHEIHGLVEGHFAPGEWSEETPISPREYSGAVWVLGDDLHQEEVEELPQGYHDGCIKGWAPLSAALSSIEPTPSPEPQASNAGAVDEGRERAAFEAWWPTHWPNSGRVSDNVWQGWLGRAALFTPEPQTGERDGEVERLTRECDEARRLAETFVTIAREKEADAFASERRLAEVEERANYLTEVVTDLRAILVKSLRDAPGGHAVRIDGVMHFGPVADAWVQFCKLAISTFDAALRAKPEAQAIVRKEAGE